MSSKGGPQEFGDYHLLEKIATGGMAEVWRARAYGMAAKCPGATSRRGTGSCRAAS